MKKIVILILLFASCSQDKPVHHFKQILAAKLSNGETDTIYQRYTDTGVSDFNHWIGLILDTSTHPHKLVRALHGVSPYKEYPWIDSIKTISVDTVE